MTADTEAQQPLLKNEHAGWVAAETDAAAKRSWTRTARRFLSPVITALIVLVLLALHQYGALPGVEGLASCPAPGALLIKAPRQNLWKNLDLQEAVDIRAWLAEPERGLNLTAHENATDSDNVIHVVEAYQPSKADALAHLANGTHVDRYAHAIINHGPADVIVDYLVGPLPISNETTLRPLSENYHNRIPLNARTTFNYVLLSELLLELLAPLDPVTSDLFNVSVSDGTVTAAGQAPMSYDGTWRRTWVQLKRDTPGAWLHAFDMYFLFDLTGTDVSTYAILAVVHGGKVYKGVNDVIAAWDKGELKRTVEYDTSDWATRARRGKQRDLDDRAGPRSYLPDGARYRVDFQEDYVTWMGWAFYLSFERDMGLHIWDINFRGERIIFELSPQEAMAQYSGSDPHQASTVWLDRAFGMGGSVRPLIKGYDCPAHATLLDATVHEAGSTTRPGAICVFEREGDRPLSRHTGYGPGEMGAVKGYELVVRSVSTVGNYDYIFDYTFQLDGTIEIRLSASGYLQGGAYDASESPYGHQLRPGLMGSLHDHIINYKIDLDVAGVRNSLMRVRMEQEVLDAPWVDLDGWGEVVQTKLVREVVEKEGAFDYAPNAEGAYVVLNTNSTNAWGNPRGYALHPGPLVKLANTRAKRTERSVEWAKHHVAVTRRKETEPCSSSMWNSNLPGAPPVDFGKFLDDESIEQEDLVVWANLGTHHIPRAEDSPNTLTNVATSYVLLVPWNFNDYDVAMESANSVLVNPAGQWEIDEPVRAKHCAPPAEPRLAYDGMQGWREDGTPFDPDEVHEARSQAEQFHMMGMWTRRD
ncbi:hypothetical protein Q5752_001236 [Cryptotrichosporon argae]